MATRMQQRRGTAAQWAAADPVLNVAEIGYESDTGKFKIGDGTNHWDELNYFLDAVDQGGSITDYVPLTQKSAASGVAALDVDKNLVVPGASIHIEGATDNSFETTLTVTNPTADRTITFPDAEGTVQLRVSNVDDTEIGYLNGVTSGIQTQMDLKAPLASPALTGDATAVNLTVSGNLTVNGTTTNLNSTSLVIEDKNIVLADVDTPTDTTANGGGITLKGATDKTFNWVDATDAWTSSEHINLASGKAIYLNGGLLKDATETLTNKTIYGASNTLTVRLANDISGFGTGVATFLATPSSSNFASMISDEIGTGNVLLSDIATNAQEASYTLVLGDKAKVVEMSNASANNLTVPLNDTVAFPVGTQIHIVQTGAGQTTVVATGGVTINATPGLKLRARWSAATLIKRAENTWVLVGDISA
jgi:hypothetical protein